MRDISEFKKFTIVAHSELIHLASLCDEIPKEGDIVIAGTWKGGDAAMFCHYTKNKITVIDSFSGISLPCVEDGEEICEGICAASMEEFLDTQAKLGTDMNRMSVYPMFIDEQNIKDVAVKDVSLLWLDLDLYHPTKICLKYFMPKLLPDGICLVHDYNFYQTPGIKRACDELGFEFEQQVGGIWKLLRK